MPRKYLNLHALKICFNAVHLDQKTSLKHTYKEGNINHDSNSIQSKRVIDLLGHPQAASKQDHQYRHG